jgi:GMP synthase-like glutamine amidotransferase
MRLAILMTNTDASDFCRRHPGDGAKFTDLIHLVRPDWSLDVFAVKDGVFPDDLSRFDGAMITGSPASVRDESPWIARLLQSIRQMDRDRTAMFGACFGHQAIALALGGTIGPNPGGWIHGLTRNTMIARPVWTGHLAATVKLYGCHAEQVTSLPQSAMTICSASGCEISGYSIGRHIYTTQHHPEMTAGFIAALTEEMAAELGPEVAARARISLRQRADTHPFALSVARFFEQAQSLG